MRRSQHLFLVDYILLCHFQPGLSIGTRVSHNYFLRLYFRTTLMLTYSEHKYVNNVLPGLEIYKYFWCDLYTPLIVLIAIIIVIHSQFSHTNVNYSGHTCNCSKNETLLNIHHGRNSTCILRYKYASQFCCTQSKLCLLEIAQNKCMYLYVPSLLSSVISEPSCSFILKGPCTSLTVWVIYRRYDPVYHIVSRLLLCTTFFNVRRNIF